MVTASLTVNENIIINDLVNNLQSVYTDKIMKPLQNMDRNEVPEFLSTAINNALDDMEDIIENHIRAILQLEFFENVDPFLQLDPESLDFLTRQFMGNSRYTVALETIRNDLTIKMMDLSGEYIRTPSMDVGLFRELATDIGDTQFHSMRRIAVTEGITAINQARSLYYETEDILDDYEYYWSVYNDNRTTPQCKEIARIVESRGGSVPLQELKDIIREVAFEFDPDFPYREFSPHYSCRSRLIRVVA